LLHSLVFSVPTYLLAFGFIAVVFEEARVKYLEALITSNGYNHYAFEGVKRQAEIKQIVKEIL